MGECGGLDHLLLFINSYLFNRYFLIAFCMLETVVKTENTMFSPS